MNELTVGQKVICKHKNGRYYQCDVVQLSKETFYEVNFDDGSFSDNLFPEDIVVRFCSLVLNRRSNVVMTKDLLLLPIKCTNLDLIAVCDVTGSSLWSMVNSALLHCGVFS